MKAQGWFPKGWILHTSYVRTNVSVESDIIWSTSVHDIHKGDALFSLVYMFKKAIKNFKVNVVVQKKALRFIDEYDNICVGFF